MHLLVCPSCGVRSEYLKYSLNYEFINGCRQIVSKSWGLDCNHEVLESYMGSDVAGWESHWQEGPEADGSYRKSCYVLDSDGEIILAWYDSYTEEQYHHMVDVDNDDY